MYTLNRLPVMIASVESALKREQVISLEQRCPLSWWLS